MSMPTEKSISKLTQNELSLELQKSGSQQSESNSQQSESESQQSESESNDIQEYCPSLLDTLGFLKFPENNLIEFSDDTSVQSGGYSDKSSIFTSDSEDSIFKTKSQSNNLKNDSEEDDTEEDDSEENDTEEDDIEEDDTEEDDSEEEDSKEDDSKKEDSEEDDSEEDDSENKKLSSKTRNLLSQSSYKKKRRSPIQSERKIFYKHLL